MEKVLLLLTAVSALCEASLLPALTSFVDEPKNWTEAQSHCREQNTDLVSVENMEDVTTLNVLTQALGKNVLAWIGLYNDVNSWRWSMSDSDFYQNETGFRNWSPKSPDNYVGKESCVEMLGDGSWNDASCSVNKSSVCMNTSGLSVTFQLVNTFLNWTDAQSYCRQHDSDLVSVRTMSENQVVQALIPNGQTAWIGLFRDTWKWLDGRKASLSYWNDGEPNNNGNENCAAANFGSSGKWEDWNCSYQKAFVCYRAPVSQEVLRLKMTGSSSLNLKDSAVLEDLLKKLKQQLKDDGVSEDIQLSWRKQSDGQIFHEDDDDEEENNSL